MPIERRLVVGFFVLAATWAVAFNVEALPFFPTVVVGGLVTGAFGLWARAACPPGTLPPFAVTPAQAALALGVGLVHVAVSHVVFDLGDALLPAIGDTATGIYERTRDTPLVPRLILSGLLTAPLEEVFWRGAFQPAVGAAATRRFPRSPRALVAVAVSTIGYTLFHVATLRISLVAAAALGGLVWAWLLERTRTVGAPIIAHAVWTTLLVLFPVV
ncbi:MAG: CPBP family intramembrane metalloprotease [Actinobacteria bacterium]|nr:CPBP family intramembrane metalloprotease [Actinomycetota bacterium]